MYLVMVVRVAVEEDQMLLVLVVLAPKETLAEPQVTVRMGETILQEVRTTVVVVVALMQQEQMLAQGPVEALAALEKPSR